jgi:hypothetical protein
MGKIPRRVRWRSLVPGSFGSAIAPFNSLRRVSGLCLRGETQSLGRGGVEEGIGIKSQLGQDVGDDGCREGDK